MAFTTITEEEREDKGVTQLPDSPQITSNALKELFDSLGNLAIDKFITHIDEISDETACSNIGIEVPEGYAAVGNVQSVIDAIVAALNETKSLAHTHGNKDTLDSITATIKQNYDTLVAMFTGIQSVTNNLTDSQTTVPNSHAVVKGINDAVNGANYVRPNQLLDRIYPVGSVYSTTSSTFNPSVTFGGTWNKITDGSIIQYERTA